MSSPSSSNLLNQVLSYLYEEGKLYKEGLLKFVKQSKHQQHIQYYTAWLEMYRRRLHLIYYYRKTKDISHLKQLVQGQDHIANENLQSFL